MSPRERALVPEAEFRTYYDRPVLKEPVWTWEVPAYFFVGGLAAGAALLGLGAELSGSPTLGRQARIVAATGATVGTGLLISDLGRPERFHHMLRVAKPTSPMSMGSWTLALFAPAAAMAATTDLLGIFPRLGRLAGVASAALAPILASYTAVLLADTAIPVWHEAYRELPFVFVGGAAAAAGAVGVALNPPVDAAPARRLLILGALLELGATKRMERALPELVAEPYHQGRSGRWSSAAFGLTAAGTGIVALAGRRGRKVAVLGGILVLAGALLERFAVVEAGRASARDPKYVVGPQRARLGAVSAPP